MSKVQNSEREEILRSKFNAATTKLAIVATPIVFSASAMAADDNAIVLGSLSIVGLTAGAATVFGIKAGPSLMMWGYRKILGFIGR